MTPIRSASTWEPKDCTKGASTCSALTYTEDECGSVHQKYHTKPGKRNSRFFGTRVQALFRSCALPNLLSHELVQRLGIETMVYAKKIARDTETLGKKSVAVSDLKIYLEDIQVSLEFLVLVNIAFDDIISVPPLE